MTVGGGVPDAPNVVDGMQNENRAGNLPANNCSAGDLPANNCSAGNLPADNCSAGNLPANKEVRKQ